MGQQLEERVELACRCAWCLRFRVKGEWIAGRRDDDEAVQPTATHTICEPCFEELKQSGLSV